MAQTSKGLERKAHEAVTKVDIPPRLTGGLLEARKNASQGPTAHWEHKISRQKRLSGRDFSLQGDTRSEQLSGHSEAPQLGDGLAKRRSLEKCLPDGYRIIHNYTIYIVYHNVVCERLKGHKLCQ